MNFLSTFNFLDDNIALPNQDDIIHKLVPNVWAFLVQLLALIVMALIVIKFAYKPVRKYLKKREDFMENEMKSAKNNNLLSQKNLEESERNLKKSRLEATEIIDKAKQDAQKIQEEMISDAKEEVNRRKKQAEEEVRLEKKQAQEEIKGDVIDVAFEASEALLKREVKKEDNEKFLNEFIDGLNKE